MFTNNLHFPPTFAAIVAGRENWLYFTVPEVPVAGADCVVYYNKAQSEPLRSAGKLQIHPRFNNWEVNPDDGDSSELQPASIARAEGVDFYSATIHIPEDAYEMNFIFSDGEAHFDNNYQQNYLKEVHGAMTKELWLDAAPERAEAAYLKRKAEEAAAAAKAEAERKAAAEAKDAEDAQNAVGELKHAYDGWRNGAVKEQIGYDGKTLWKLKGDVSCLLRVLLFRRIKVYNGHIFNRKKYYNNYYRLLLVRKQPCSTTVLLDLLALLKSQKTRTLLSRLVTTDGKEQLMSH